MTENDYIAEYIKEKRPEIIDTLDFHLWKLVKTLTNVMNNVTNAIMGINLGEVDLSEIDLSETEKEEQDNDIQGDET